MGRGPTFKGKALLVIDRLHTDDPNKFHWDIHPFVLTGATEDPGDEINNAFWCMSWDSIQAPAAAYKMQVGDRIRVAVTYEIHFSYDNYSGEHDMNLYLTKERVLRYQPYNFKKYRKNFYKFWAATEKHPNR